MTFIRLMEFTGKPVTVNMDQIISIKQIKMVSYATASKPKNPIVTQLETVSERFIHVDETPKQIEFLIKKHIVKTT